MVEQLLTRALQGAHGGMNRPACQAVLSGMSYPKPAPAAPDPVAAVRRERVVERVVERSCAGCSRTVIYGGRGRRPRYCSAACRQRAWALRQAERALGTSADPRPAVVREVVERVVERTVEARVRDGAPATVPTPTWVPGWEAQLEVLVVQLRDEAHPVAREHWRHARLLAALDQVLQALDAAHPGGLRQLDRRRRR